MALGSRSALLASLSRGTDPPSTGGFLGPGTAGSGTQIEVMLRASPPLSAGQASHYYKSEFSRGDYYTARDSEGIVASRWQGQGARQLGLSGRVKAEEFARLLDGRDSSGRKVLVARREGLRERRAGWDVTISPHKSVSLTALVGGDQRLLEAHDRAVSKALTELERTRRHGFTGAVTLRPRGRW
jgi:hypothetical protein